MEAEEPSTQAIWENGLVIQKSNTSPTWVLFKVSVVIQTLCA